MRPRHFKVLDTKATTTAASEISPSKPKKKKAERQESEKNLTQLSLVHRQQHHHRLCYALTKPKKKKIRANIKRDKTNQIVKAQ